MSFHILNPYLIKGKVSAPLANLASGTVSAPAVLNVVTRTSGALLFYTVDGSFPTVIFQGGEWLPLGTTLAFTQSISMERTTARSDYVFRFIAVKEGFQNSDVTSLNYHVINVREFGATCEIACAGTPALFNPTFTQAETGGSWTLTWPPTLNAMAADADSESVFVPDPAALVSQRMDATVAMVSSAVAQIYHGGNLTATGASVLSGVVDSFLAARLRRQLDCVFKFNESSDNKGAETTFFNALDATGADNKFLRTLSAADAATMQKCMAFWPMHETSGTTVADVRANGTGQSVTYHGTTQDVVGQWDDFTDNGNPDMEFRFVNDVNSAIAKIHVTVDESSGWVWSTFDNRYYPAGVKLSGGLVATQYSANLNLSCYGETVKVFICTTSTAGTHGGKTYRLLVYYANGTTKIFTGKADLTTTPGNLTASGSLSGATTTGPVTTGINTTSCLLSLSSDSKFYARVRMVLGGWVQFGDTSVTQCLAQKNGAYTLYWTPTGGGTLVFRSIVNGQPVDRSVSFAPGTSQWHFVACGYGAIAGSQYTNAFVGVVTNSGAGFSQDYGNLTNGIPGSTGGTFSLGGGTDADFNASPFKGVMAEWAMWGGEDWTFPWDLWVKLVAGHGPLTFPMVLAPKTSAGLVDYVIEHRPTTLNGLLNSADGISLPITLKGGTSFPAFGGSGASFSIAFWLRFQKVSVLQVGYGQRLIDPPIGETRLLSSDWGLTLTVNEAGGTQDRSYAAGWWNTTFSGTTTRLNLYFTPGTGSPGQVVVSRTIPDNVTNTWHLCCVSVNAGKIYMSIDGENWVDVHTLTSFVKPSVAPRFVNTMPWPRERVESLKFGQLAVWNRKLTRLELVELFNNRNGVAFADWTN